MNEEVEPPEVRRDLKVLTWTKMLEMIHRTLNDGVPNFNAARDLFAAEVQDQVPPSIRSFRRVYERYREHGVVNPKRRQRRRQVRDGPLRDQVTQEYREQPIQSARAVARRLGAGRETVRKIVKETRYPYKPQKVQRLRQPDLNLRLEFARQMQRRCNDDLNFSSRIIFTDESTFTQQGPLNKQNLRNWAEQNPRWIRRIENQYRWSILVWAGIIGDFVIGPHFFEENLTGASYLRFLQTDLQRLLDPIRDRLPRYVWWQQDGAPPHSTREVREYLNELYPQRWFGRNGASPWPPRSPDLTPLDFFLWGHIKNLCYREEPTTRENMLQRIRDAFATITPRQLQNARRSFLKRIGCVIEHGGENVEQYL